MTTASKRPIVSEGLFNPEMLVLARMAKEMTQGDLAVAARTTQGRISKIEHGRWMLRNEGPHRRFADMRSVEHDDIADDIRLILAGTSGGNRNL